MLFNKKIILFWYVYTNFIISHLKICSSVYVHLQWDMKRKIISLVDHLCCVFFFHLNTSCQLDVLSRLSTMNEQHTSFKGLISVGNRVINDMRIVLSYLNMSACHQMDVGKVNTTKKKIQTNLSQNFLRPIKISFKQKRTDKVIL